jgi:conserved oligomeric Golgi complex subunit 6
MFPMDSVYVSGLDGLGNDGIDSPSSASSNAFASRKANALSTKLATVLSSSYADSEIREALRLLDIRVSDNLNGTRHNLKAVVNKEVIDVNTRIIDDFGQVAEVSRSKALRTE